MSKALVLSYPGCIMFEVMLACELISKAHAIELATFDGQPFVSTTGLIFQAHMSYADVNVQDYNCLMVPGGDTQAVIENATLEKILRTANAEKILIGAICAGPLLLAKAGMLKGRKFTHGFGEHYQEFLAPYWDGAEFVDESVVVDGNIVTAKPEAHIDFGVMLARMTEAIADDKEDYFRSFYKGNRLPELAPVQRC